MSIEIIPVTDREQWLSERVKDVTSTEVSALYGLSPYKSEFELFHEKRDGVIVKLSPNERMTWGTRLESAIAHGAAEDMGWNIAKLDVYMRQPDVRIGSSFDFEIKSSSDGPGILEIKNVDGLQYQRNWIDDGSGNIEAPEHIELQIQHQMEVSGYSWCALVALVGGNQIKVIIRNRDRDIGADIRDKVAAFWQRVAANQAPTANYFIDSQFIIKLHQRANDDECIEADAELQHLISEYHRFARESSDIKDLQDQCKARILERIGTASKVVTPFGSLSCGMVKDSPGKLITPDMVGTTINARAGYRNFRFNPKKAK